MSEGFNGSIYKVRLLCNDCNHRRVFHIATIGCSQRGCNCTEFNSRRASDLAKNRYQYQNNPRQYPMARITSKRQLDHYPDVVAHKRLHERM